MIIRELGYRPELFTLGDDELETELQNIEVWDPRKCIDKARTRAEAALKFERILDWRKILESGDKERLTGTALAAARIMAYAEELENSMSQDQEHNPESPLVCAFLMGVHCEAVIAQLRWQRRNPDNATKAKKEKVKARREALAEYIKANGERPEKRPGVWYEGFREAYSQYAVGDKTLKVDYPHALSKLRKQT